MAIVNRQTGFRFLHTHRVEGAQNTYREETNCMMWYLRSWDDKDYFYVEIFQGNAFHIYPIDTLMHPDILDKIKNDDKTFLYIANTHEAFLDVVEPLYESLVLEAGIPPRKIYIANEAPDLYKEVIKYADKHGLEYMNVEWILEFEYSMSIQANDFALKGFTMLRDKKYDKRYLNFNRRWRLHRPTFVALLKAKGLLDKGYVSLAPADDGRGWENMWPWILGYHKVDDEIYGLLKDHEQEILNLPPLYLDTDELVNNRATYENKSKYLYENSLLSIVTETTFYRDGHLNEARFLSEKIFKPIALGHPFIFMTVPKSLEALREIGYKTFHPFIDESYDNEFNDQERMKLILKEVEKICNYTDDEVREFCKNVKPICDYNQELLKNKTKPFRQGRDPHFHLLHKEFVRKTL